MFNSVHTTNLSPNAERGVIECEKCQTPIVVNNPGSVSVEFSVPCPHCGHRGIYFKRMLSNESGDRRKHPRG